MANQAYAGPSDEYSLRSRASSIISTGTKTSIGTFLTTPFNPQPLPQSAPVQQQQPTTATNNVIDILLGRRNFRISARPGSILSISSYDMPAPPYSEAINTPAVPVEQLPALQEAKSSGQLQSSSEEPSTPSEQERSLEETQILSPTPRPPRPRVQIRPSTSDTDATATEFTDRLDNDTVSTTANSSPPSPPLSPLESSRNAISAHYTNVVRTIDTNHRAEVSRLEANYQAEIAALRIGHVAELEEIRSAHAAELKDVRNADRADLEEVKNAARAELATQLAATRNEIDAVYRGEFARMRQENYELQAVSDAVTSLKDGAVAKAVELDGTINDLEAQVERLEREAVEREKAAKNEVERLEREAEEKEKAARNEVEDVWEKRWLERMNLAKEQVAKASNEARMIYEEVEKRWPDEADEVREAVKEKMKSEETSPTKGKKTKKWAISGK